MIFPDSQFFCIFSKSRPVNCSPMPSRQLRRKLPYSAGVLHRRSFPAIGCNSAFAVPAHRKPIIFSLCSLKNHNKHEWKTAKNRENQQKKCARVWLLKIFAVSLRAFMGVIAPPVKVETEKTRGRNPPQE